MKKFILFPFILSSLIIGQSYVLNFDGSNDYLSVAASDNASTKLDGQFTISAWVFIEGADKPQIFYNDGAELEWLGASYNFFRIWYLLICFKYRSVLRSSFFIKCVFG